MEQECCACGNTTTKCIQWPRSVFYCHNCFTIFIEGGERNDFQLNVLRNVDNTTIELDIPKLKNKNSQHHAFFSIYGIQKFCEKVNKETVRTNWSLVEVKSEDDSYKCTFKNDQNFRASIPKSVVDALNEEIMCSVYDENVYKKILIKS